MLLYPLQWRKQCQEGNTTRVTSHLPPQKQHLQLVELSTMGFTLMEGSGWCKTVHFSFSFLIVSSKDNRADSRYKFCISPSWRAVGGAKQSISHLQYLFSPFHFLWFLQKTSEQILDTSCAFFSPSMLYQYYPVLLEQ